METEKTEELQRKYLEAVLIWLNLLLERDVVRWQQAGQDPSDRFRGLRVSDADALALTRQAPGEHWGSQVKIPEAETRRLEAASKKANQTILSLEEEAQKLGISLRLKALAEIFELSEFEWWAFILCLAPALDLRFERIYGYLQDDVTRNQASVDLILNLLLPVGLGRLDYLSHFEPSSSLRRFRLVRLVEENGRHPNLLRQAFQAAPQVVSWVLGAYTPQSENPWSEFIPLTQDTPDEWATSIFEDEELPSADVIETICPFVSLYGEDVLLQDMVVRRLSSAISKPLYKLTIPADSSIEMAIEQLTHAVRDARMLGALLYLQGVDLFIDHDKCLLPAVFTILRLLDKAVLMSSTQSFKLADEMPGNDYPLMRLFIDRLSSSERADLWTELLEGAPEDDLPVKTIESLAGQFNLTTGQIVASASTALSQALQKGRSLQSADLFEAARFHSGNHLAGLARKIEPRYNWGDLVLPETPITMLHELVSMVKSRPRVLEEWGLGRKLTSSMGIAALFTGPPGTGKTLAAQIIAHELGIDLYRIDLSTVVSKYIGETEKNLERIFNEAQTSNAILLFDEADAIFGKRSEVKDAHDRYANIEVGYLLQRMEAYDGVAILATNLRANLDEAFTRRLQFIINFPFPEEEYRQRIWEVLMPPGLPRAADLDFSLMAKRFKLAGGSIRNSIVSAAFIAADNGKESCCVEMKHLMHGVEREMQKMGKLIQETDFVLSHDQKGE